MPNVKKIATTEDYAQCLQKVSEYAQAFLVDIEGDSRGQPNMAVFAQAVVLLQSILESPFRGPKAAFGIGLLRHKYALSQLPNNGALFQMPPPGAAAPTPIKLAQAYLAKAQKYYLMAAEMPDDNDFSASRAKLALGQLYEDQLLPVPTGGDPDKIAFALAMEVAQAGFAEGMMSVGNKYYAGRGVEKNLSLSLEWYLLAQKNKHQMPRAYQDECDRGVSIIRNNLEMMPSKPVNKPETGDFDKPAP